MSKKDDKAIAAIIIAIVAAFAIAGAFTTWFHNDYITIIGVLLGIAAGWGFYKA